MKTIAAVQPIAPKKGCDTLADILDHSCCRVAEAEGFEYRDAKLEKWRVVTDRVDGAVKGRRVS